jgi:hypothetical protein
MIQAIVFVEDAELLYLRAHHQMWAPRMALLLPTLRQAARWLWLESEAELNS